MVHNSNINEQIREKDISFIMPDGIFVDSIPIQEALFIAEENGLDLVEVSPSQDDKLAICKLMDYGKMKYQQTKKHKGDKHKEHVKEIKTSLNISDHDLDIKHRKILLLLSKGKRIRYCMELTGREKIMFDHGIESFKRHLEMLNGSCSHGTPSVSRGKSILISTLLEPIEK